MTNEGGAPESSGSTKTAGIFLAACIILVILAVCSFHDIIYSLEIASRQSQLIETGAVHATPPRTAMMLLLSVGLLSLYGLGYLRVLKEHWRPAQLFGALAIITAIAFACVPFDSGDFAVYINQGHLQAAYKANPYTHTVTEVEGWSLDPLFRANWNFVPNPHGPVFALIMNIICSIGGDNYQFDVYLIKALCAAAHLAIAYLIWRSVSIMGTAAQAMRAVYLYGFSPYMLMHGVANCHNDILLAFFSCLSIFLYLKGKHLYVLLSALCGAGIKYISVIMTPWLVVLLGRTEGWKTAWQSLALGLVCVGALSFIYLGRLDAQHATLMFNNINMQRGNIGAVFYLLPIPAAGKIYQAAAFLVFIFVSLRLFIKSIKEATEPRYQFVQQIVSTCVLLQALTICLIGSKFASWYLAMFFPLSLFILDDTILRRFCIFATCLMTFSLMWMGYENPIDTSMFLAIALASSFLSIKMRPERCSS